MVHTQKRLIVLAPDTTEFEANGKRYLVEKTISPQRYELWQKFAPEVAYGFSVPELFKQLRTIYDNYNKGNEVAVIAHNLMRGLKEVNENTRPAFWKICALYINTEDENRKSITEEQINAKINDWYEEGVDVHSFFVMALSSLPGFIEAYKEVSQDTSLNQSQTKEKRNTSSLTH